MTNLFEASVFKAQKLFDRVAKIAKDKFDIEQKEKDKQQAETDKKARAGVQRTIKYTINGTELKKLNPTKLSQLLQELINKLEDPQFTQLLVDSCINAFGINLSKIQLDEVSTKKAAKPAEPTTEGTDGDDTEKPEVDKEALANKLFNVLLTKITTVFDKAIKKHMEAFKDELGDEKPKFKVELGKNGDTNTIDIMLIGGPTEYSQKLIKGLNAFIKENKLDTIIKEAHLFGGHKQVNIKV